MLNQLSTSVHIANQWSPWLKKNKKTIEPIDKKQKKKKKLQESK